ncbi:restriction endonuclease subunit S [Methylosinus sp. Ce-a6]|uniref:restriction endonuclease subunit S n=1 Tax=Methylosinus sp. Ce-a6 TaxID=2172005 RepID=UPI00135691BF|nr:restriction endonuclease subunit S [Methylosinus sp. Ce-a6]
MRWPIAKLKDIARIERDGVDPKGLATGTKYVGLEHVSSCGSISAIELEGGEIASTKFAFTNADILFGKLRPYLRKIARPSFGGVCSTDIVPIRVGSNIDRGYLFHFLRTDAVIANATSLATGANLPRLSPKILETFEVPVPPLDEQRRIAAILDQADDLRRKRREALGRIVDLSRSNAYALFGDPLVNPKEWRSDLTLGEVSEIASGVTKGRKLNGAAVRSVPYLAVANVQDGAITLKNVKYIDATEEEIRRLRLKSDDLLLTEGGDPDKLGRGSLWNETFLEECIHQNHVFRVRIESKEVLPAFLNWLIGSDRGKRYFLNAAKQTTGIASINMTQLRAFPLLVPPLDVQYRFVEQSAESTSSKPITAPISRGSTLCSPRCNIAPSAATSPPPKANPRRATPSPARGRMWPREARSDEGPHRKGEFSTRCSHENPHPTRLRRATFSHEWHEWHEWEKECAPDRPAL